MTKDICANRHQGNLFSQQAHASIPKPSREQIRNDILEFIRRNGNYGATSEEISTALGFRYTTVSARCSELKRDGLIIDRGFRKTESGRNAAVLVLV